MYASLIFANKENLIFYETPIYAGNMGLHVGVEPMPLAFWVNAYAPVRKITRDAKNVKSLQLLWDNCKPKYSVNTVYKSCEFTEECSIAHSFYCVDHYKMCENVLRWIYYEHFRVIVI